MLTLSPLPLDTMLPPPTSTYNAQSSPIGCRPAWDTSSLFSITHSRQSVLYHSQSSVCSPTLTVVSLFSNTHSRQSVLYHSQSSVCSLSLTVVSLFFITHSRPRLTFRTTNSNPFSITNFHKLFLPSGLLLSHHRHGRKSLIGNTTLLHT